LKALDFLLSALRQKMRDYKKLEVWKRSHDLNLFVYLTLLPKFPKSEQYDLLSQTKRSAYIDPELFQQTNQLINEVKAMLIGLIKTLRR
jgi:hypothetical protein